MCFSQNHRGIDLKIFVSPQKVVARSEGKKDKAEILLKLSDLIFEAIGLSQASLPLFIYFHQ